MSVSDKAAPAAAENASPERYRAAAFPKREQPNKPRQTEKGKRAMKKRFSNIDELDKYIERQVSRTVKAYYTDWKNIDRPKYMSLKGSSRKADKNALLITRECGTYLFTFEDLERSYPATVATYYAENAKYYILNLEILTAETKSDKEIEDLVKEITIRRDERKTA